MYAVAMTCCDRVGKPSIEIGAERGLSGGRGLLLHNTIEDRRIGELGHGAESVW